MVSKLEYSIPIAIIAVILISFHVYPRFHLASAHQLQMLTSCAYSLKNNDLGKNYLKQITSYSTEHEIKTLKKECRKMRDKEIRDFVITNAQKNNQ